jgi:hypothetical protein
MGDLGVGRRCAGVCAVLVGLCQVGARGRLRRDSQPGAGRRHTGQVPAQQASKTCSSPSSCHNVRPTPPVSGGQAAQGEKAVLDGMQGVKGSNPLSSTAGQGLFLPSTDRRSPAPGSRLAATAVAQADPSPTGAFTGGAGWRRLVGRRARGLRPPSDLWLSSQHQMINGGRRAGGLPQRPGATGGGELAGRGRAACGRLVGAGGRSPRRSWAR